MSQEMFAQAGFWFQFRRWAPLFLTLFCLVACSLTFFRHSQNMTAWMAYFVTGASFMMFAVYANDLITGETQSLIERLIALAVVIGLAATYVVAASAECERFGVIDSQQSNAIVHDGATCLYFNVMTITTVGYGDVVPSTGLRPFVAVEACVGYLISALLIAAILGVITAKRTP